MRLGILLFLVPLTWNCQYPVFTVQFIHPFTYWYENIPEILNFWRFKLELKVGPDSPFHSRHDDLIIFNPLSWSFTARKFAPFPLSWLTSRRGAGLTSNLIEEKGRAVEKDAKIENLTCLYTQNMEFEKISSFSPRCEMVCPMSMWKCNKKIRGI